MKRTELLTASVKQYFISLCNRKNDRPDATETLEENMRSTLLTFSFHLRFTEDNPDEMVI